MSVRSRLVGVVAAGAVSAMIGAGFLLLDASSAAAAPAPTPSAPTQSAAPGINLLPGVLPPIVLPSVALPSITLPTTVPVLSGVLSTVRGVLTPASSAATPSPNTPRANS